MHVRTPAPARPLSPSAQTPVRGYGFHRGINGGLPISVAGFAEMNAVDRQHLLDALEHPVLHEVLDTLILVLDRRGCIVSFNQACEVAAGFAEADVLGRHFDFLIPEDQRQNMHQLFAALIRQGEPTHFANTWVDRRGRERFIQWSNTVLRDGDDRPEYVIATGIDVTGYRETLRNWLDADNRYRALVETSADIIWETDVHGRYRYISPRILDLLGYTPEEITGQTDALFLNSETEIRRFEALLAKPLTRHHGFRHFINRRRHKDGHEVIFSCSGVPYFNSQGELLGYRGTSRDVTDLHRMEQRLQQSERRLRLGLRFSGVGTWDWHIPSGDLFWSDEIWDIFGQDRETFSPGYENFLATIHPDDRGQMVAAIENCLNHGKRLDMAYRIIWSDGSVHWVRSIGNIELNNHGKPESMLGVVMLIDERKQAEQRLQASERRYRFLVENAADAIALLDENAFILEVNQRTCHLFEHARNELVGVSLFNFVPPGQRDRHRTVFEHILRHAEAVTEEIRIRTRGGREVPIELRAVRLSLDQGVRVQIILRDITARRAQEQARLMQERRQRNALVREVHHRIKNNLQGILGLLRQQLREHADPGQVINKVIGQIQSIALIHGIHGQRIDGQLLLCQMLPAILDALPLHEDRHQGHRLERDIQQPLIVQDNESVALALILNELLTNASKHANSPDRPLIVSLATRPDTGEIRILSPGARLPPAFDFARCQGCHTGLELVRALMPRQGLELHHEQTREGVCTRLHLQPPVVRSVADETSP